MTHVEVVGDVVLLRLGSIANGLGQCHVTGAHLALQTAHVVVAGVLEVVFAGLRAANHIAAIVVEDHLCVEGLLIVHPAIDGIAFG